MEFNQFYLTLILIGIVCFISIITDKRFKNFEYERFDEISWFIIIAIGAMLGIYAFILQMIDLIS